MSVIGVSPSDIILLARYTCRVVSALKEKAGAKSEYQETIKSLESLSSVLQELHDLSLQDGKSLFGNSVKLQAHNSVELVSTFVRQISKYDKHLGSKAPSGCLKGSVKKVQWEMKAAGDLDKFRKAIIPQLEILRFMITNETQLRQRQATDNLSIGLKDLSSLAIVSNSCTSEINQAFADFQAKNETAITGLKSEVTSISTTAHDIQRLTADSNHKISEIPDLVSAGHDRIETSIAEGVNALQCQLVSTRNEHKATADAVDIKFTQILTALMLSSANSASQIAELKALMPSKSEKRGKTLSSSGKSSHQLAQPETALENRRGGNLYFLQLSVMAAFTDVLMRLCSNPITLSMWLGVQIFLAAPISFFGGDYVWFEDALGNGQKVSLDCYQHFEIFEAFLRVHFREKPGQSKVQRKEYQMLLGNSSGLIIDEESWIKMLRPRSKLIMSMIMAANGNRCPKCNIHLNNSEEQMLRCNKCQQQYGKRIKEQQLGQIEPSELIPFPSEDMTSQQFDILPETQSTTDSANLEQPQEIENREVAYFKHMHLTLLDQSNAADVQQRTTTQESASNDFESNSDTAQDFEHNADPELQKGRETLESDNRKGVTTRETKTNIELLGNEALMNGTSQVSNSAAPDAPQDLGGRGYRIKATEGEKDFDSRYVTRKDGSRFFKVGRVIALLWPEAVGSDGTVLSEKYQGQHPGFTKGRFNQPIYTSIRRMVVVMERKGYCWCLPISTYNNRGTTKRGLDPKSHAIIYMGNSGPQRLAGETEMIKEPLSVDPAPGQKLDKLSRLNFDKVYTVEHNVRVMDIGKVSTRCMPKLVGYWENHRYRK